MELIEYLKRAKSPYHVVESLKSRLLEANFSELNIETVFQLKSGQGYFVSIHGTSLFAFTIPQGVTPQKIEKMGLRMASAHTDFPTFKVKPCPDLAKQNHCSCLGLNVEPYGGMLKRTWFDRPLGLAGIVYVNAPSQTGGMRPILYESSRPLFLIPSLAPHMDRAIESKEIDVQKEIVPLIPLEKTEETSSPSESATFLKILSRELDVAQDDILAFDLNLFLDEQPVLIGNKAQWLSAQAIDNVASVALLGEAIVSAVGGPNLSMACMFDNEEIGSRTKQGADSNLFTWVLERIFESPLLGGIDRKTALFRSTFLSVDGAHAIHPNFPEKSDPSTLVKLGCGPVIKSSASHRYATDARVTSALLQLCAQQSIPIQRQANRSGSPGGQTLGPIVSSYLPIPSADVGIPMLGMHSIRETAAMDDCASLGRLLEGFFRGRDLADKG